MNKIILTIWVLCIIFLIVIFGNKSNRRKFIKKWKNIEKRAHQNNNKNTDKNNDNSNRKFPLYQLVIYYTYVFIIFAVLIIGPFFIQALLVAVKEYLYVPEDSLIVYDSGIEILCYFAGFFILAPIIVLIDLLINRGFLLEIDRQKMKFSARDDGMMMNIIMSIFCVVIAVPLLFLGLNHYRYCTEEKIVIKTLFTQEKIYYYDDISYVVRHEYNVDANVSPEEIAERFDYKVYFKDGNSYKISDTTTFETEIVNKYNIRMELDN